MSFVSGCATKRSTRWLVLALCIAGPALAEPIVDYENLPVKTQTGAAVTPEEVRAAIVSAASTIKWEGRRPKRGDLKWDFTDVGPGKLVGTLAVHGGRHMIEVNIPYAADRYSVLYRTSRDMDYKDSDGVRDIHPNYNVWMAQLVRAINLEFARFVPRPGGGDAAVEVSFWESVRNSANPAEVQAYLDQFPNGRFAILARNRLSSLGVAPKAAPPSSAAPASAAAPAAPKAAASAGVNAAIPRVGDSWTYRFVPQRGRVGNYKVIVTAASTLGVRDRGGLDGIEPLEREHSPGQYLAPQGPIWLFSPYLLVFDATPPQVWELQGLDAQICPGGFRCSVKGRVRGTETITVLAGTFVATKVEIELKVLGPRNQFDQEVSAWVLTAWYAPEVKRVVKYHSRGSPSSLTETRFELELVSYKLN